MNIHYDNAKVEYRTDIEGWVASDGRCWGKDEHRARWSSCDIVNCLTEGCSNTTRKTYTRCSSCRKERQTKAWEDSVKREVSEEDIIYYSDLLGEYFDLDDALEKADEMGVDINTLLLYHCEREKAPEVDVYSLYEDITPEGFDVEDMVNERITSLADSLNKALREHPVNCFTPTKIGVSFGRGESVYV